MKVYALLKFLKFPLLGLLLTVCPGCQKEKLPNILFIITDQQSINTIGAYGNEICKTPNIDRIADRGMIFRQCHVASYACSPSRASILTGLYSHNHGVVTNEVPLHESLPSLGYLLKKEGYATAYFGKSHLGGYMRRNTSTEPEYTGKATRDRPWNGNWQYIRTDTIPDYEPKATDYVISLADGHTFQAMEGGTGEDEACLGFDYWIGGWQQYRDFLSFNGYDSIVANNHTVGGHGTLYAPVRDKKFDDSLHAWSIIPEKMHQEAFFVDEALTYLKDTWTREKPFGMFLSFYGPHNPILPPRPWDEMYPLEDIPLPATIGDQRKIGGTGKYRRDQWSDDQFRDYIRRYWGFVSFIDAQIGELLNGLEAMGELENTIIVFTSDHGDMAGGHGNIWKSTLCSWDELMRVPLIVSYPSIVSIKSASNALVSNMDFLPTLLEMIQAEIPQTIDGKSFAAILKDPGMEHRDIIFTSVMGMNFIATTREWKYNLNLVAGHPDELYDRKVDPDEMNNLINDPGHIEVAEWMKDQILTWLSETGHPYALEIANTSKD